jgi:serine/threonine protein phosphatase PrpC
MVGQKLTRRRRKQRRTRRRRLIGGGLAYGKWRVDGAHKRRGNEDVVGGAAGEKITVLYVFDGHGGPECSGFLEASLIPVILKRCANADSPDKIEAILKEEFLNIDDTVIRAKSWAKQTGSTGSVCVVTDTHVICANVGDSPAFIFDKASSVISNHSVDHDGENPEEVARVLAAGGQIIAEAGDVKRVNGELAVTRAFGDFSLKPHVIAEPQTYIWPRVAGSILAICSDGLTETQTESGITHGSIKAIAESISSRLTTSENLQSCATFVVNAQQDKFISNSGKYLGDNVSLIIAAL